MFFFVVTRTVLYQACCSGSARDFQTWDGFMYFICVVRPIYDIRVVL